MFERHRTTGHSPGWQRVSIDWISTMLYNCRPKRYAIDKKRMLRVSNYSRQCLAQLRGRHRHPVRRAQRRHAAAVSLAKAGRQASVTWRCSKNAASPTSCWTKPGSAAPNPPWRNRPSPAACACPKMKRATAFCSPTPWPSLAEGLGVQFSLEHRNRPELTQGPDGRISGVRIHNADGQRGRNPAGRSLCACPGQLSRPLLQSTGLQICRFTGKGLFADDPHRETKPWPPSPPCWTRHSQNRRHPLRPASAWWHGRAGPL